MRKTGGLAKKWNAKTSPAPNNYNVQESLWILKNKKIPVS